MVLLFATIKSSRWRLKSARTLSSVDSDNYRKNFRGIALTGARGWRLHDSLVALIFSSKRLIVSWSIPQRWLPKIFSIENPDSATVITCQVSHCFHGRRNHIFRDRRPHGVVFSFFIFMCFRRWLIYMVGARGIEPLTSTASMGFCKIQGYWKYWTISITSIR